jgi:hypothetical protein
MAGGVQAPLLVRELDRQGEGGCSSLAWEKADWQRSAGDSCSTAHEGMKSKDEEESEGSREAEADALPATLRRTPGAHSVHLDVHMHSVEAGKSAVLVAVSLQQEAGGEARAG